ncbi:YncE family protein [Maridesulfovibrio bastinii]|uniref:YncE family protein n=1 Tax=Maridesulfovibrio bastinii TaxID=47157 RepID=UPI0003FDD6CF|nr:hypothetical protein [Maridesulfovibrio bastinii]
MNKISTVLLVLVIMLHSAACFAGQSIIEGFSSPESVTSDGTYFYVSNVGTEIRPLDRDGDGFISRVSADGLMIDEKFIEGLDAPKGIAALNGVLYVADLNHLKGYSTSNGRKVFDLDFSDEGTSFLNGIAVIDKSTIAVSATDVGNIYLVAVTDTGKYTKIKTAADLNGPNGLSYDCKSHTLYIASYGSGKKADGFIGKGCLKGASMEYKKVFSSGGFYDGIVAVGDKLLFSDWVKFARSGVLRSLDLKSGKIQSVNLGRKIGGPADFYYDSKEDKLWIPMMMEGKVMIQSY